MRIKKVKPMKKAKRLNGLMSFNVILLLLVLAVFLVSGQAGCASLQKGSSFNQDDAPTTRTGASSKGLDFAVVKGSGYLSAGREIKEGQVFAVNILIENYEKTARNGDICIDDDIEDSYGGIPRGRCQSFRVNPATYEGDVMQQPSKTNVFFDEQFNYKNLDSSQTITMFVTMDSFITEKVSTQMPVPEVKQSTLSISNPSQLNIKFERDVIEKVEGYEADMDFTFSKKDRNTKITTADKKHEGIVFNPTLEGNQINCNYDDPSIKLLKFDQSTSIINVDCSSILPVKAQTSYQMLLDLQYNVEVKKEIQFKFEKEEAVA